MGHLTKTQTEAAIAEFHKSLPLEILHLMGVTLEICRVPDVPDAYNPRLTLASEDQRQDVLSHFNQDIPPYVKVEVANTTVATS
jgi:hypothetical protein